MAETGKRRRWAEDELVKVLSLYCQIQFGQMHSRNPLVMRFARELGRTAASVALKLVNFASFDPALRARGRRGMSNASQLDRVVWERYYGRWKELAFFEGAEQVVGEQRQVRLTAEERTMTVRLGQWFFRNSVLSAYQGSCCVTGIQLPALLRASHIVPWSISEQRRLDPTNGICLNALHDAAFDAGLLSFDDGLHMLVSRLAREAMPLATYIDYFQRYEGKPIRAPERFAPSPECLQYHRENVFIA